MVLDSVDEATERCRGLIWGRTSIGLLDSLSEATVGSLALEHDPRFGFVSLGPHRTGARHEVQQLGGLFQVVFLARDLEQPLEFGYVQGVLAVERRRLCFFFGVALGLTLRGHGYNR